MKIFLILSFLAQHEVVMKRIEFPDTNTCAIVAMAIEASKEAYFRPKLDAYCIEELR